ncbi:MAG TPA: 30S ribosomal protein S12 methylthiotransferase RimO, partial [Pseudomonadaceae bacterium]|nr:30S ribosomal protein S12 methylthiotransferase RimO [Pseudomonadaceae bacterium]
IVGFPGETDADFEELLGFLEEAQLDRVGCFKYSAVDGAQANALPDHVPEEVKQERWERFMALQQEISAERLQQKVGLEMDVLVDAIEDDRAIARSKADAPEIDGLVYLEDPEGLQVGDVVTVTITAADDYDLYA